MKDLIIQCTDLIKTYGTPDPLNIKLLDNTTPLANKNITIRINGVDYNRTTKNNGTATLNINLQPGTYNTLISFYGDSTYAPSTKSVMVKVNPYPVAQQNLKRDSNSYFEVNQIPLDVIYNDGFSTTLGTKIKETEMLMDNSTLNAPTFRFNQGNHGIKFEISIVMKETYYFKTSPVMEYLDEWNKYMTPVTVVTDAMDIPNGKYIMQIKKKKQKNMTYSIWDLTFNQYYENNLSFNTLYNEKQSTFSIVDQVLYLCYTIDKNSPKEAIYALQLKLQNKGCWTTVVRELVNGFWKDVIVYDNGDPDFKKRTPNGVWDNQMQQDIFSFQFKFGLGDKKNGICDRETILALIDNSYEGQGFYDVQGNAQRGSL